MKKNVLKFEASQKYFPPIGTMKSIVPAWYKEIEKYIGGKLRVHPEANLTVKHCMPFLDSLTTGYYIPLAADILVEKIGNDVGVSWKSKDTILKLRTQSGTGNMEIPAGCTNQHFVWQNKMSLQCPKGYSLLITHPLNRFDLPFVTLSGLMDAHYPIGDGNLPVFFKKDFEGVIPQGTPIAQIIPVKLDSWEAKEVDGLYAKSVIESGRSIQKIMGWYKTLHWNKKEYT